MYEFYSEFQSFDLKELLLFAICTLVQECITLCILQEHYTYEGPQNLFFLVRNKDQADRMIPLKVVLHM